jgi:hypothetical protein
MDAMTVGRRPGRKAGSEGHSDRREAEQAHEDEGMDNEMV